MNGCGTEPAARLTTSRWVTSAGHENTRRAAVIDDLPVVGAVSDRTHVGMICVPRQVDTAPGRSVVPMRVIR